MIFVGSSVRKAPEPIVYGFLACAQSSRYAQNLDFCRSCQCFVRLGAHAQCCFVCMQKGLHCANAPNLTKHWQERQKSRFFIYRELCTEAKKPYKIGPGAFRTELPTKIVLKTGLRPRQARFWRVLGPSWAAFGWLLVTLGRLLGPFGRFLGALGRVLDPLGRLLAGLLRLLGAFLRPKPPRASI